MDGFEHISNDRNNASGRNIRRRKRSLLDRFFRTLFTVLGVFVLCVSVVVLGYNLFGENSALPESLREAIGSNIKEGSSVADLFSSVKERTNFLILGTDDEGSRTDTIIVGSFNSKTNVVSLISIPRDTWVQMPENRRKVLDEQGLWAPSDGMKLTEVHHYAGGGQLGIEFVTKQVEELLGNVQIEYYAKVDLDAFKFIVDAVDGVEFDVPVNMRYDDPYQDLHINLTAGPQMLYGEDAMGLVRYRSYPNGDWQRMAVQQEFIKALVTQTIAKDKIIGNAGALIQMVYTYVETNLALADSLKYIPFATKLSFDSMKTYTLGGTDSRIRGKDVILNDAEQTNAIVQEVFYAGSTDTAEAQVQGESSVGKKIQILNGGYISGLAGKNKTFLEDRGFTVSNIGDYTGDKKDYTRIYVRNANQGKDLQALYSDSIITVDSSMNKAYDIVIVLGKNES